MCRRAAIGVSSPHGGYVARMRPNTAVTALVGGAVMLVGCSSNPTVPTATTSMATTAPSGPSFDCAQADSQAEKMVCDDPQLMALDRQLADEYEKAMARPHFDRTSLEAAQRSWASGRDDCWKASDVHRCVLESYQTRLFELRSTDPAVATPPTVTYRCPDDKPFTAEFYGQFDPKAAVLTWGTDTAIVFAEESASGARYGRDGVDFWEHQGEVTVDFFGNKFVCRTP